MNPLWRFIIGAKGFHVRERREEDEEPHTREGAYRGDAAFILGEAERRASSDLSKAIKREDKGPRKKIITTSDGHDAPTIQRIDEPAPEPEPERLSLRERWRKLREEVNKLEQK